MNKQAYLKGEIHIKNVQESRRNQRLLCRYIFNIINVIVVTDTYLVLYQVHELWSTQHIGYKI